MCTATLYTKAAVLPLLILLAIRYLHLSVYMEIMINTCAPCSLHNLLPSIAMIKKT